MPIIENLNIDNDSYVNCNTKNYIFVDWNKLSKEQLSQISKTASIKQGSFRSNDNLNCFKKDCNNKDCQDNIDYLYSVIVDSLKESC